MTYTSENHILKKRMESALDDLSILEAVRESYAGTFERIGLPREESIRLAVQVTDIIRQPISLEVSEQQVSDIFWALRFGEKTFAENLKEKLKSRTSIVFAQLSPHLQNICGKVIDFGAGSGLNAQAIHDQLGLDVECIDISDFKHPSVSLPIRILDKNTQVPVEDGYYQAGIIINVLHHEKDNEKILQELTRIMNTGGRLVVIETIPADASHIATEVTFANDVLWNRYFNSGNIPVPGTFAQPEAWIRRFEEHGWVRIHDESLGIDQPTMPEIHHLFVFERINS